MAALKFAIANVGMRQSRELTTKTSAARGDRAEIDAYLNDPTR